jgi:hypothetical protein
MAAEIASSVIRVLTSMISFDTVAIKYNTMYSRQKLQNLYKTI